MLHQHPQFLDADVDADNFIDLRSEDNQPDAELAAEELLVRALVHEVQTAALLCLGAGSAVNLAQHPGGPRALSEARTLIADFTATLDHWPRRILEEQLTRATLVEISGFYAAFRNARSRLGDFEREAREIGLDRAGALHVKPLQTSWRLASRHAGFALRGLMHDAGHVLTDNFNENQTIIETHLSRVLDGRAACCQRDGMIVLPRLAERRRAPRRSLLQTAIVRTGSSEFTAFARDISAGGIGLTRMPEMAEGTTLLVELSCGRIFTGTVAWSRGNDTGLRFDRQLSPTDPMIFG